MQQDRRSQWQFLSLDEDRWLWEVKHADGSRQRSSTSFPTLKACVDDAKQNGWATWRSEERRSVITGRDSLEHLPPK
jgi:hypothetical protein